MVRVVKCPQCGTQVDWDANPFRPFCSERCRLVDLGAWLGEKYVIPSPLRDESGGDEDASPTETDKPNGHDDDR